jgi:Tfp pilus assembly protein PilX
MKYNKFNYATFNSSSDMRADERGSATIIAILVLGLLTIFTALAISRTTSEAMVMANDSSEGRAYTAAEASLEMMTRNFNKVFDIKLSPSSSDLDGIRNAAVPGFTDFTFNQNIIQTVAPEQVVLSGDTYQGLNATRDKWKLQTVATDNSSGTEVVMMREFYNNRIPIFQFGIFYDDNMEFHPGPKFAFGGRVHSNSSIFMMAQTGLYFSSRVTAVGEIITEKARNGSPWSNWNENVFIKNASGVYRQLRNNMGSVLNNTPNGPNLWADGLAEPVPDDPDMPPGYVNANWSTYRASFDYNLLNEVKPLNLPIKASQADYVELVRRPKTIDDLYNDGTGTVATPNVVQVPSSDADDATTARERFANKTGLRVSFADTQSKLPGCATLTVNCGVRLDGAADGGSGAGSGYNPRHAAITPQGTYSTTTVNGARLNYANGSTAPCSGVAPYNCTQSRDTNRQVWAKVELVWIDTTSGMPQTFDVTKDILSLGVTEPIASAGNFRVDPASYASGQDGNSIIKLQRYAIPGSDIKNAGSGVINSSNYTTYLSDNGGMNVVVAATVAPSPSPTPKNNTAGLTDTPTIKVRFDGVSTFTTTYRQITPFPIEMFDTREGLYNDSITPSTPYPGGTVPWSGVMSVLDIDVNNLRRFLNGNFNSLMPTTTYYATTFGHPLRNTDVPDANGWVLYVSDRRGDRDFDGQYDMEDIYGPNDGILQTGEDKNRDGILQKDYDEAVSVINEAPKYAERVSPDQAAVLDHKYYRRAVRLINGQVLPGIYDSATPLNTKGFTVSSENGVYVKGNYNATSVVSYDDPTPSTKYLPQNTADHIPAAIIADAVMILSNNWNDGKSFRYPFSRTNRLATQTTVRFAMMSGDAVSSLNATPNQGGGDPRLNGGVHNFKRFLEDWGGVYLNYCGSLINLYYSHNNSAPFKCCTNIYSPPNRNWIFDATFLDPARLPPGTPFFQYIQVTGFLRINN